MVRIDAQQIDVWKSRKNYSGTTESALWGNAGPSAYQLHATALKTEKLVFTSVVFSVSSYIVFECPRVQAFVVVAVFVVAW